MRKFWIGALAVALGANVALANWSKIELKDGTVLIGTITKMGNSYNVKTDDGKSRIVPSRDVVKLDGVPVEGATPAPAAPGNTPGSNTPPAGTPAPKGGADFQKAKAFSERVTTPSVGVITWQAFVDKNPNSPDIDAAKAELEIWKQRSKDNARKVNGTWLSGEELEKLQKKIKELMDEAIDRTSPEVMVDGIEGLKKIQEVLKLDPDNFSANFEMGFYFLVQSRQHVGSLENIDKAIKALEKATKLEPEIAEPWANLAIAYNFRKRYEESVKAAWQAVQIRDTKELAQTLANALYNAPGGFAQKNPTVRKISEQGQVLFRKHGIAGGGVTWLYLRPNPADYAGKKGTEAGPKRDGIFANGTGFFVSEDGYIMTNRHVAEAGEWLIVRLDDGTERMAERIVIDDEQDIAIIKIKMDAPLPNFIKIAHYDTPNIGGKITVMGFPMTTSVGRNIKITEGVITGIEPGRGPVDVIVDATVNPGNSGGPMLDKFGNLAALVAMKTVAQSGAETTYGMGLSPERIRKFLQKHIEKLTDKIQTATASTESDTPMDTEALAKKYRSATVLILMGNGDLPEGMGSASDGKPAPAEADKKPKPGEDYQPDTPSDGPPAPTPPKPRRPKSNGADAGQG